MNSIPHKPILFIALLLAILPALLQAAGGKALSPYVFRQLTTVQQQMEQGAYNDALGGLQKLGSESGQSAYEQAIVQQMLGYVQLGRESWPAAIKAFENSLALKQLPETTGQHLRYNLAQLYLTRDQPDKTITILKAWFDREDSPSAPAYVLLAQARAVKKQYRKAIPLLQTANGLSDEPHAEWYETLLAMHYELQSWRDCVPLLKKMIRLFPQHSRYWQQLAGVYMALNDQEAALAALELAFRQGVLSNEQERLQLAQLYLATGVPYKAARLIEQQLQTGGISNSAKHRELLAHAWSSARERKQAIDALEGAIGDDAKPELRLKLAQWYMDTGRWRAVTEVLKPVNTEGNGRMASQAALLLGIAHFELGNTDTARKTFQQLARQYPENGKSAQQWLDFIDSLSVSKAEEHAGSDQS